MTSADLLADAFGRIRQVTHAAVDGLAPSELAFRPEGSGNSIAWLAWHLTRIQDDHVADAAGTIQVWVTGGWADRFSLPFDASATGYGHTNEDVGALGRATAELLTGYHDAVYEATQLYVAGIVDVDLERVVDTSWDPPVTLGVRLVSVISDNLQHAGQAAYVRGLLP